MRTHEWSLLVPLCVAAGWIGFNALAGEATERPAGATLRLPGNAGNGDRASQPVPSSEAALPSTITTSDGVTYKAVKLVRVHPDGLLVSYRPEGGGLGMAKLKFRYLSEDLRQQYGYDPAKAAQYEAEQAKAKVEIARRIYENYKAECEAAEKWRQDNEREMARREEERIWREQERLRAEAERKRQEQDLQFNAPFESGAEWENVSWGGGFPAPTSDANQVAWDAALGAWSGTEPALTKKNFGHLSRPASGSKGFPANPPGMPRPAGPFPPAASGQPAAADVPLAMPRPAAPVPRCQLLQRNDAPAPAPGGADFRLGPAPRAR